jgi:twitching motility protein PilU
MDSALPLTTDDDLGRYLQLMVAHGASDLFLSSGSAAALKSQVTVSPA